MDVLIKKTRYSLVFSDEVLNQLEAQMQEDVRLFVEQNGEILLSAEENEPVLLTGDLSVVVKKNKSAILVDQLFSKGQIL